MAYFPVGLVEVLGEAEVIGTVGTEAVVTGLEVVATTGAISFTVG